MWLRIAAFASLLALAGCADDVAELEKSSNADHCVPTPVTPELDTQRTACGFEAGAKVADTIGLSGAMRKKLPIDHVIVMMKENRSFDCILGEISKQGQPDAEPVPDGFSNPDPAGTPVPRYHETNTCFHSDPDHQWEAMHAQANGGKMDGFVKSADASTSSDGHFVMGYFDQSDLPFYYFLGTTFALADHYFASALTGTWPNRDYLLAATSDGVKYTGGGIPQVPTIFDALDAAGVSWGIYTDGFPLEGALLWFPGHEGTFKMPDFYDALAKGTLPEVTFVDGRGNEEDDHPPADMNVSEKWSYDIFAALVKSPIWSSTVLFYTYDEAGGFADHVPPPKACVARPEDSDFFELGIRVPTVVVSPWAKRNHVSHVQHEHTSILRFIELLYDLPAFTARDANSDAMLDMFDFCSEPAAIPDAPQAGSGGCNK
jgi:phospholipase C